MRGRYRGYSHGPALTGRNTSLRAAAQLRELPPAPPLNPRNPMAERHRDVVAMERIERRVREIQSRRPYQGKVGTDELLVEALRLIRQEPSLAEAVDKLSQVDFAAFPGLYDMIPWKQLEAAAKR